MRERLNELRAIRERLAEQRPHLEKSLEDARVRYEAVLRDASAMIEWCRACQAKRTSKAALLLTLIEKDRNGGSDT